MPNIHSLLKAEITRLARKELRNEIEPLKKVLAVHRSEIATLKKLVRTQQVELKRASKGKGAGRPESVQPDEVSHRRFRPAGLRSHREKLGLSAKDYGRLIDASALSVYKGENGKVKPQPAALTRIMEVRSLGKREALRRLEALHA